MGSWVGLLKILEDKSEVFSWSKNYNGIFKEEELPLGALTTKLLHINCNDESQVKEYLDGLGGPEIYDLEGNLVPVSEIGFILKKEQRALNDFVQKIIAEEARFQVPETSKDSKMYFSLPPSERLKFWDLSIDFPILTKRLANVYWYTPKIEFENSLTTDSEYIDIQRKIDKLDEKMDCLNHQLKVLTEEQYRNVTEESGAFEEAAYKGDLINKELQELEMSHSFLVSKQLGLMIKRKPLIRIKASEDFLALLWLEVNYAAENNYRAYLCQVCKAYFFHAKRKDRKVCYLCKPPSRLPIGERSPVEQETERFRGKVAQRYYRGSLTLQEANSILTERGLVPINQRKSKKKK